MSVRFSVASAAIELARGDITSCDLDAIGNAANAELVGGGGVDGAIHRAAGPELMAELVEIKKSLPGGVLGTGDAVITAGYRLPARFVIHCVGPIYAREGARAPTLLASCYRRALEIARDRGIASIAFPSISTGVYGYPVAEAAGVAIRAVWDALVQHSRPALVRFVLFDDAAYGAYVSAAETTAAAS